MNTIPIVEMMINEINDRFGQAHSLQFMTIISQKTPIEQLQAASPAIQIRAINSILDSTLATMPNTTELRSWLINDVTPEEYISSFKNQWVVDLYISGVLSPKVA